MVPSGRKHADVLRLARSGNGPGDRRARLLLADDHGLIGAAFENLLTPAYDVIGRCEDGLSLLSTAERQRPDIVILDISMPRLNGLDAARRLKKTLPKCRMIFLTMNDDPEVAAEAFSMGASGYVLKTSHSDELFQAIEQALMSRTYITPLIAEGVVQAMASRRDREDAGAKISPRQRQVLQLLAEGNSMKEVARFLNISQRTVAFHKYKMMEQLNLKTTADLIRFAVKDGIISN